jgi:hypothetical protein
MSAIETLSKMVTPARSRAPFRPEALPAELQAAGYLLEPLLSRVNGFYAFESALQVFGTEAVESNDDIAEWNSAASWRQEFGEVAEGLLFFAQDIFGGQFAASERGFFHFNIESAELQPMGKDIEEWATCLLSRWGYWTGHSIAHEWQVRYGPLKSGHRLFPKVPFVLGGAFEIENLWEGLASDAIGFFGYIASQLRELPDGTRVELELPNGEVIAGVFQR